MFVIKASTPEAMRNEIVKWLSQQASSHRSASRIASKKTTQKKEVIVADTYEGAAKFLEACMVDSNLVKAASEIAKSFGPFLSKS